MENVQFEGTVEIKKPPQMTDEQCRSAWALPFKKEIDIVQADGSIVKGTYHAFLMCYQPSEADLKAMNAGAPLWLKIMGEHLVPHAIFTQDQETGEPNV